MLGVHLYVYHTVFVTSSRQGVGNGVNFRRKFLEFPILLRAERPEDVTNVNTQSKGSEIESNDWITPLFVLHKPEYLCTVIVE